MKYLLGLALLAAVPAYAEDGVGLWLNSGMRSYHTDRAAQYREDNYGLGAELRFSQMNSLHVGVYQNSINLHSKYIGWGYQPLHIGNVRLGVLITGVTGYYSNFVVVPLPYASMEYHDMGINLIYVPSVVAAVQLKFKLGELF